MSLAKRKENSIFLSYYYHVLYCFILLCFASAMGLTLEGYEMDMNGNPN
jgi:hypothetical protein